MSIYTDVVKLRTPPKYAALRLAWEAYYVVSGVLTSEHLRSGMMNRC